MAEIKTFRRRASSRRRGAVAVLVVVLLVVLLGAAALAVDVGMLYNTKANLQRSADAAALAGAERLLVQDRVRGGSYLDGVLADSMDQTKAYASRNNVIGVGGPTVASGDVDIGFLGDPNSATEALDVSDATRFNAVAVTVRRDELNNGAVPPLFSWIFGATGTEVAASATAAAMDGIAGYRVTAESGNAELLPLALRLSAWDNYRAGLLSAGDNYSFDPVTGTVSPGPDGIPELNLYPGSGAGQLPPGNFGTVDIGPPGNSTADLARQIRYGVSAEDLDYFGGALVLGDDGTVQLNGDTGLSAGIKDDLAAIIGLPRAIPLFTTVTGNGNNAMYTVVGFAGIRIMSVRLTGSMAGKHVLIQPAVVVDDATIVGESNDSSYFVYYPVRLVR
jgi:Flp pilus assembly protein TadG